MSQKTNSKKKAKTSATKSVTRVHKIKAKVETKPVKTEAKIETEVDIVPAVQTKDAGTAKKRLFRKRSSDSKKTGKAKNLFGRIFFPIVALIRYLKQSWRELCRVHWPSRKSTWAMTFAVVLYTALFLILVLALDNIFSYLFKLMIGN